MMGEELLVIAGMMWHTLPRVEVDVVKGEGRRIYVKGWVRIGTPATHRFKCESGFVYLTNDGGWDIDPHYFKTEAQAQKALDAKIGVQQQEENPIALALAAARQKKGK